jgi:hypothetical protein
MKAIDLICFPSLDNFRKSNYEKRRIRISAEFIMTSKFYIQKHIIENTYNQKKILDSFKNELWRINYYFIEYKIIAEEAMLCLKKDLDAQYEIIKYFKKYHKQAKQIKQIKPIIIMI